MEPTITEQLLLGTAGILVTVIFHVVALVSLAHLLQRFGPTPNLIIYLGVAVIFILAIHTIEAWGWAVLYIYLGEFSDLEEALYFSAVTTTTLGYGDITLSLDWRLLSTFEAMGGLILFGASTAFMMDAIRRLFAASKHLKH